MEQTRTIKISGIIQDIKTEEYIVDANIYLKSNLTNIAYSNISGRFTLEVGVNGSPGDTLIITSAGYERFKKKVDFSTDLKRLNVRLRKRQAKTDRANQDQDLVKMALNGDQRAYGKLMARYRDSIFFMIQKMVNNRNDAEDLTIEAFGKAFQNLHKYSAEYAFSTWLYRIAINNCIDFIRKKRLETFSLDESLENDEGSKTPKNYASDSLDPEEKAIKEERILRMRGVIERLHVKYRRLIELRYLKEYSYDEIAKEMGLPLGTVKAQLFRAKELLKNMIHDKDKFI